MTNKISDNDIKKALEICQGPHDNDTCNNCKYKRNFGCRNALCNDILDYINRLEAENERLQTECENQSVLWSKHFESIFESAKETIKSEAYKECIEKVKSAWVDLPTMSDDEGEYDYICVEALQDFCDNLLKEMVGEDND